MYNPSPTVFRLERRLLLKITIHPTTYNDIMNLPPIGCRVARRLCKDESVMKVLSQFRNDYPEFVDYPDSSTFAILNIYRSIDKILESVPICPVCKKRRCVIDSTYEKWESGNVVYKYYCSNRECRKIQRVAKTKATNMQKYGCEFPLQNQEVYAKSMSTCEKLYGVKYTGQIEEAKIKRSKTNMKRYGVVVPSQNKEIQDKTKVTNMKRYGAKHPIQNSKIKRKLYDFFIKKYGMFPSQRQSQKDKVAQTNLERYGDTCSARNDEVKKKAIQTSLINWGTEHPSQSDEIKNKVKETFNENYGYDNCFQSPEIMDKLRKTCLNKYGTNTYLQSEQALHNKIANRYKALSDHSLENYIITPFDEFFNICKDDILVQYTIPLRWHCNKCNEDFEGVIDKSYQLIYKNGYARCPNCHKLYSNLSCKESELGDFVSSIYTGRVLKHDRTVLNGKELDLYLPDKHLAFEFDGIYWHSELNHPGTSFHLHKTVECEKLGIHLIHIFENEWLTKREIVNSRIKNLLGLSTNRIFARKCTIKEVDSKTSIEFQDVNHLQGHTNAKIHLGLYYQDELVSLMTFGKPRFDSHHEWELLRFCNKLDTSVVGAASKLLIHFERMYKPNSIVSYADRRWSNGKVYRKLGFILDHISEPNYWYWKSPNEFLLLHRVKFQKHKLSQLLENFDPNLTEVENMYANGYNRIFDCGNLVFTKICNVC